MTRGIALASVVAVGCVAVGCGGPPPAVRVEGVEVLGVLAQPNIVGRDGGPSASLWGRSVWTFGDTIAATADAEQQTWHHNSYAAFDPTTRTLTSPSDAVGAPRYLVPPTDEEAAFNRAHRGDPCAVAPCGARWAVWPGQPAWDAARARAIVPYGLIAAAPGDFNFRGAGQSFGIWRSFDEPVERSPALLFPDGEPAFGVGPVIDGDDYFVFGCEENGGFDKPCRLARVALDSIWDRAAWRFWDGAGWSDDVRRVATLFNGWSILTVVRLGFAGVYAAIYSSRLSNDVVLRTAPTLTGPWSEETLLFVADHGATDGTVYDAVAHEELSEEDGRVLYLSHSRPNGNGWFGAEFAWVKVHLRAE